MHGSALGHRPMFVLRYMYLSADFDTHTYVYDSRRAYQKRGRICRASRFQMPQACSTATTTTTIVLTSANSTVRSESETCPSVRPIRTQQPYPSTKPASMAHISSANTISRLTPNLSYTPALCPSASILISVYALQEQAIVLTSAPEVCMPHLRARQHQYSDINVGMVSGVADNGL